MTAAKAQSFQSIAVPSWMLLVTIFLTGNIIMMLEVVGTRVVGPYFGVGIYVWSALITVTLLALAGGYWFGGKAADKYKKTEWLYLGILTAGLLTLLIPVLRGPILTVSGKMGLKTGVLVGSSLLFGPPLFILGMDSPYATKLFTRQFETLGSKVGLLYAVSTLGSFLGTITMGFYLIPQFPLTMILLFLGFVLITITLVYFLIIRSRKTIAFSAMCLLMISALMIFPNSPSARAMSNGSQLLYKTTSFYGEIKVLQVGHHRMLLVDGVTQSGEDSRTLEATPPYVNDMGTLAKRFCPHAKEALLIGLGGGNMVHILKKQNVNLDVVEIDKKIKEVAIRFFEVNPKEVNIILNDGRRFVKNSKKKYDIIVLNTFNGESFPYHLLTKEFFHEVKAKLNPNGIMLLNFVGYVKGRERSAAAAAVMATIRAAYPWGHSYFRQPGHRFSNIVYVAGQDEPPPAPLASAAWEELRKLEVEISGWKDAIVCTDDYNPVEFLNRMVCKRWRDLVMESLGPEILLQ